MIRWFTYNDVAANLLMLLIILAGLYALPTIPMEVLPRYESDVINIRIANPGATPEEMERDVVMRVEEAIHDLEGIKEIISTAVEGTSTVDVEVARGYQARELMDDLKARIDAINHFPEDIERPDLKVAQRNHDVISVVLSADMSEADLRRLGEKVRDDIAALNGISQVELTGVRPYEIAIEVSEQQLQRYGLTFEEIARAINRSSLNVSTGTIKSKGGDILLSSRGQAYSQEDFEKIVIRSAEHGIRLVLGDIATVTDGFMEGNLASVYQGKAAVMIDITRVGNENAIAIADAVKQYINQAQQGLPANIEISYWRDRSKIIKGRINTLLKSACQGGILVFLLLTIFLRLSVALWVCVGIPVSFLGVLAIMPLLGVTINVNTVFAFIMVLGVVVDDAIVTGENIYRHLQQQVGDSVEATIAGVKEVAAPVTFGVLTTVVAFVPMLSIEGRRGQMFAFIALIVIPALLFSLLETKFILPAHLKHCQPINRSSANNWLEKLQNVCGDQLAHFITVYYRPFMVLAVKQRYFTGAVFFGTSLIILSLVIGGHIGFTFFPRIESEVARAKLTMPVGTPYELTDRYTRQIANAAQTLQQRYINEVDGKSIIKAVYSVTGQSDRGGNPQPQEGRVMFEVEPPESRVPNIPVSRLVREWREQIGTIPGVEDLNFRAEIGHGGSPVDIQLKSNDLQQLEGFAKEIKIRLLNFSEVFDVNDNFEGGKQELRLNIKPRAEFLGLTLSDLSRQVRQAFYGLEVQRIQRNREELKVMLRYPLSDRLSLDNLESMYIRTPEGIEVPFADVAELQPVHGSAVIRRIDRNRAFNITADINKRKGNINAIRHEINGFLQQLSSNYPDVRYSFAGEAKEQDESFSSLVLGMVFMLVVVYALLAIPFASYTQPFIVMSVIPFGLIGAVLGHLIMGMNLTMNSVLGMLALSGVVVNDSLVLIDRYNQLRKKGESVEKAIINAGCSRFRAILLTSLTTFVGLVPLIFEQATQAQFLIPMAVSLGFGILFTTIITLVLVPALCVILEDVHHSLKKSVLS
ncbi:MAG: MMPL family transporter [Methylomarinum sp.]|nr:MMPL family transporter [Methylomarinum sp.]